MSDEEKEAIYELEDIRFEERINKKIDIVLNLIDKQDKAINRLAQWVANLNSMVDKQSVKDIVYKEIENE